MDTVTAHYEGTKGTIYSIAETINSSLADATILAKFAAVKPTKYVPGLITTYNLDLTTAMDLPDDVQLSAIHQTDKIELIGLRSLIGGNFQWLKGYIHDGWGKEFWTVKYNEAGMVDYSSAEKNTWTSVVKLSKKMNDFIIAYPTQLAAGHMTSTFPGDVTSNTDNFATKYSAFKSAKQTTTGTDAKLTATNLVYSNLQDLQNDAHIVFKDDLTMLKLFMIEEVRKVIAPLGSASLSMDFIEVGTNLPVGDVKVTIQSATGVAIVKVGDALGELEFLNVDPDNYRVLIDAPGRPEILMTKEVNTGVNARMKVMIPAV